MNPFISEGAGWPPIPLETLTEKKLAIAGIRPSSSHPLLPFIFILIRFSNQKSTSSGEILTAIQEAGGPLITHHELRKFSSLFVPKLQFIEPLDFQKKENTWK